MTSSRPPRTLMGAVAPTGFRIAAKKHDDLVKVQTIIDKSYYPQKKFRMLEPLERRKFDVSSEGGDAVSAVGAVLVAGNLSVVSQETAVSSIATVVTGMQNNVNVLIKVCSCLFGHFDPSPSNVHNLSMPLS